MYVCNVNAGVNVSCTSLENSIANIDARFGKVLSICSLC